ncbi:MAG TPA: hypothetical protein VJ696_08020 [Rhodanobacteraceae bacterium]|nr:hypothetical protein [Rhodanobacteraceae bacterium]
MDPVSPTPTEPRRERRWDAFAAVVAALIGFLALLVSGYTAYVQRQQVRAAVWPYLILSNYDTDRALYVFNKGVGPAILRSARVKVDGTPQPDWEHVLDALAVPKPRTHFISTIHVNVLSPGDRTAIISFEDEATYRLFRNAALARMKTDLCYCSTLGDCWAYGDSIFGNSPKVEQVSACPVLPESEEFQE